MSETALCLIFPKSARWIQDYENSHGSFPAVMAYLLRHEEAELEESGFGLLEARKLESARKNIFKTALQNIDIPLCIRACYSVCLDGAVITKLYQKQIGQLLMEGGTIIQETLPENICHFLELGQDIRKERIPKNALGLAIDISSIQNTWLYEMWPRSGTKPFCVGSSLGLGTE